MKIYYLSIILIISCLLTACTLQEGNNTDNQKPFQSSIKYKTEQDSNPKIEKLSFYNEQNLPINGVLSFEIIPNNKYVEGEVIELKLIRTCENITRKEETNVMVGSEIVNIAYPHLDTLYSYSMSIPVKLTDYNDYIYGFKAIPIKIKVDATIFDNSYIKYVKFKDNSGVIYEGYSLPNIRSIFSKTLDCNLENKYYGKTCDEWFLSHQVWIKNYFYNNGGGYKFCIDTNDIPNCVIDVNQKSITPECFIKYVSNILGYNENEGFLEWNSILTERYGQTEGGPNINLKIE